MSSNRQEFIPVVATSTIVPKTSVFAPISEDELHPDNTVYFHVESGPPDERFEEICRGIDSVLKIPDKIFLAFIDYSHNIDVAKPYLEKIVKKINESGVDHIVYQNVDYELDDNKNFAEPFLINYVLKDLISKNIIKETDLFVKLTSRYYFISYDWVDLFHQGGCWFNAWDLKQKSADLSNPLPSFFGGFFIADAKTHIEEITPEACAVWFQTPYCNITYTYEHLLNLKFKSKANIMGYYLDGEMCRKGSKRSYLKFLKTYQKNIKKVGDYSPGTIFDPEEIYRLIMNQIKKEGSYVVSATPTFKIVSKKVPYA